MRLRHANLDDEGPRARWSAPYKIVRSGTSDGNSLVLPYDPPER